MGIPEGLECRDWVNSCDPYKLEPQFPEWLQTFRPDLISSNHNIPVVYGSYIFLCNLWAVCRSNVRQERTDIGRDRAEGCNCTVCLSAPRIVLGRVPIVNVRHALRVAQPKKGISL